MQLNLDPGYQAEKSFIGIKIMPEEDMVIPLWHYF